MFLSQKTSRRSSQPAGLQLQALLQCHIDGILARERQNMSRLHLYRTGDYWVAFEQSSYLLHLLGSPLLVYPVRVAGVSRPFTMASMSNEQMERLTGGLPCLQAASDSRTYESRTVFSGEAYRAWHRQQLRPVLEAMENGYIPC